MWPCYLLEVSAVRFAPSRFFQYSVVGNCFPNHLVLFPANVNWDEVPNGDEARLNGNRTGRRLIRAALRNGLRRAFRESDSGILFGRSRCFESSIGLSTLKKRGKRTPILSLSSGVSRQTPGVHSFDYSLQSISTTGFINVDRVNSLICVSKLKRTPATNRTASLRFRNTPGVT